MKLVKTSIEVPKTFWLIGTLVLIVSGIKTGCVRHAEPLSGGRKRHKLLYPIK